MISKIEIRNIASFDATGIVIDGLKKINFIYGSNGCGKTTISKCLSNPDLYMGKCKITWLNENKLSTYVYNKDFRERNFGNSKIPGVFTLGNATIQDIEKIENKKSTIVEKRMQLERLNSKRNDLDTQLKNLNETFTTECWNSLYKKYENNFSEEMAPKLKNKFFEKLLNTHNNGVANLKSIEELEKKKSILYKESHVALEHIAKLDFNRVVEIENDLIWSEVIVGKQDVDISEMISSLGSSDWVQEGIKYLRVDSKKCPFCQRETIDDGFRKKT